MKNIGSYILTKSSNQFDVFKLRCLFLALVLFVGIGSAWGDTWDGTSVASSFAGGSGTEADPYIISKADELVYFANWSNGKSNWVKLTADIDLGGNYWVDGTTTKYGSGKEFKGKFVADKKGDGTNYTISNFKLLVPNTGGSYGLLCKVTGGTIRNIDVKDVTIDFAASISVAAYVGGLVGSTGAKTEVENCHVTGVTMNLNGLTGAGGFGGLIGYLADATTVRDCSSTDFKMTSSGDIKAGGVAALIGNMATKAHAISGCTVANAQISVGGIFQGANLGALLGYCSGAGQTAKAQLSNCSVTASSITFKQTCGTNSWVGLLAAQVKNTDITGCHVTGTDAEHPSTITVEGDITAATNIGGLVGNMNAAYTSLTNSTVSNVTITAKGTSTNARIGGMVGNMKGQSTTSCTPVKGCSTTNVKLAFNGEVKATSYAGGLVGLSDSYVNYSNNTVTNADISFGNKISGTTYVGGSVAFASTYNELKNLTVNGANISVVGTCTNANLGGLVGYIKGQDVANRTPLQGCYVMQPNISVGGAGANTNYVGGLVGQSAAYVNIFNNKVETPAITINGAINGNSYFSGGVGQINNYNTLDGFYVKGGSIAGPTATGIGVKNGTEFFIGGALGKQVGNTNAITIANLQNQVRNVAVEGMNINLTNFQPATGVMKDHKFIVGGVIGQCYSTQTYKDECGIPENLISKDVKLYAPHAMTSPLVGGFNTPSYTSYVIDDNKFSDDVMKSRTGSWAYSGYKLGLSNAVLSNAKVKDYDTKNPGAGNVTRNFTTSEAAEITGGATGVKYISLDALKKTNRYYDLEYTSKTVLWWTNPSGSATSANSNVEQYIYPQNGATTAGLLTTGGYPHTMYFYQGINHGKKVTDAGASALIAGIDANVTNAKAETPVTLTISDAQEKVRGFCEHTLTATASVADGLTYEWYVDGEKQSATGNELSVKPHWRFGKGIRVNAINSSSNVVASASYSLLHGVFKTKNSANTETDYVGMPTANRGTKENPYIIDCPEALHQLSWVSTFYNAFCWETLDKLNGTSSYQSTMHYNRAYYELDDNINLNNEEFTPISHPGTYDNGTLGIYHQNYVFAGHFDGKGFAIKNFKVTWRGGIRNADSNNYYGLFGAVGWGATSTTEPCVIQNLIIDNAQLVHDTSNTSFYYNNGQTTTKNNVQLGILAGMVTANTTIQNVEVRNSKITDENDTQTYNMASKYLAVGGIIGRVQSLYSKAGDLASSVTLRFLSADCDISLTHAAFDGTSPGTPTRLFTVGGVVGSLNTTTAYATINMPQYTYFTGKVDAPRALAGPCFGSVEYSGLSSDNYGNYWQRYMAKTSAAKQEVPNLYYGNYQIQTYTKSGASDLKTITSDYPAEACGYGSRTITAHNSTHPNSTAFYTSDNYYGEYQGVNYGEYVDVTSADIKTDIEDAFSLGLASADNNEEITGLFFVFDNEGRLILTDQVPLKVLFADADYGNQKVTEHKLTIAGTINKDDYTYKWYNNGELVATTTDADYQTYNLGVTPQLVYVEIYDKAATPALVYTTDAIDLPRFKNLEAEYAPKRKIDLGGTAFDGVFTVTPDAIFTTEGNGITMSYDWKEWVPVTTKEETYTEEIATEENNRHLIPDSEGRQPGTNGYVTTYGGALITDKNGKEPGDDGYENTYAVYNPVKAGDKYLKTSGGDWVALTDGATGTTANAPTSTTTNANERKTYKCCITATDTKWQTFLTNHSSDSHYSDELKNKYLATLTTDVIVKLMTEKVVFLHPTQSIEYGIPAGKDDWGTIPSGSELGDKDHPVRTWGKAYSLLDGNAGSTWDFNKIVLVGTSTGNQTWGVRDGGTVRCNKPTNDSDYGLSNLFSNAADGTAIDNESGIPRYDQYIAKIAASPMGKNVTITGKHDGIDYQAVIESPQLGVTSYKQLMHFYGNTKFEHLTFYGGVRYYDIIAGHYHDLWFGDGLIMKNFNIDKTTYGTIVGVETPRLQIFGGMSNDNRFNAHYDAKNGELDRMLQKTVPNGEKGFTLTFRSGFYSIICTGSRQTDAKPGMQGSPNMPIKCTIDVDLDQKWNIAHQLGTMTKGSSGNYRQPDDSKCTPYDIALILAGNHEGAMCADVDINVRSGRIARIVNGSLGAYKEPTFKYDGVSYRYPINTYFGRANILLAPASSEKAKDINDINKRVIVTELYNGGVGRSLSSETEITMPTMSKNTLVMKGGTIGFPDNPNAGGWDAAKFKTFTDKEEIIPGIYGGGAGGANGIGYCEHSSHASGEICPTHTKDELLPYWSADGDAVLYGTFTQFMTRRATKPFAIHLYNADTKDNTDFDLLDTSSEITIEDGVIGSEQKHANIFGAGSGFTSTQFLVTGDKAWPNTQAGNMYGSSKEAIVAKINIIGGTVYGNVYGAGRGTDYYYTHDRESTPDWSTKQNNLLSLGQTYGSVVTNITGGSIYGNVYGAGYGAAEAKKYNTPDTYGLFTETAYLAGDAILNIGGNAQVKSYTNPSTSSGQVTYGGNVYGGGMLAKVEGNTTVNISGSVKIEGNVFGAAQGITNKTATTKQTISGTTETYLLNTDDNAKLFGIVKGNTTVATTGAPTIGKDIYGGAESAITEGNTTVTINGGTINDVFGGGLGSLNDAKTAITSSANVNGNTSVTVSSAKYAAGDKKLHYIYGGGNLASVIGTYNADGTLISGGATSVNISTGVACDQTTVYGGGYGANTKCANTSVTINAFPANADGDNTLYGLREVYGGGNAGPVTTKTSVNFLGGLVLGDVFGGGNEATVGTELATADATSPEKVEAWATSNGTEIAMVQKEGANATIYGNIFGGGNKAAVFGNSNVSISSGTFAGEVFGGGNGLLKADNTVQTSADVKGNTSVYVNGATVIWNKLWKTAILNDEKTEIATPGELIVWGSNQANKEYFIIDNNPDFIFLNNHNIYGGGNKACKIGTYYGDGQITSNTGTSTVDVNKGFCDKTLLSTTVWKNSFSDNANPHFYVFGGGYGAFTKVGTTYVNVGLDMETEIETSETDQQLAPQRRAATNAGGNPASIEVYDNNYGIAGYTVLGVVGGGYAGLVKDNTEVHFGGDTYTHRIFGGGYGQLAAYQSLPEGTQELDGTRTLRDILGEVGGKTRVYVDGGYIHGDVFGGGAGVESIDASGDQLPDTDFPDMGRVAGAGDAAYPNTYVEISKATKIFGNVYGGGDVANVGTPSDSPRGEDWYATKPSFTSTFDASGNRVGDYAFSNAQSVVNILGGDIYGKLFAGGNGRKKSEAADYTKLGRIEGNTLLHVAESKSEASTMAVEADGTIIPTIWNRIYGGCSFGTVDGNTLVHIEGGKFGHNIFGGGFGDVQTDVLDNVLGMKDGEGSSSYATYANVLGNTKVQIDGGSWIWDRYSDDEGNITIWKEANKKLYNSVKEVQALIRNGKDAVYEVIKDVNTDFYKPLEHTFRINHNIFGGGNRACMVGTYSSNDASLDADPATNTGLSEVILNHSLTTKVEDANGNILNMLDPMTIAGLCWYHAIDNTAHPQFSVFGAGYGVNTKVGKTKVYAGPGIQLKSDGTGRIPESDGGKPQYAYQTKDMTAYNDFETEIFETFNNPNEVTEEDLKMYYGSLTGSRTDDRRTYLRYRASRWAWSTGCPNFTFMDIHGGGFSGYVQGDCDVITDCQLAVRNLYGGGLGSKPMAGTVGNVAHTVTGDETYGTVGGNTSVKVYGGNVSLNVFGGGAGVESIDTSGDQSPDIDFPDIARVNGKSSVEIYGEAVSKTMGTEKYDTERVLVFGSVYGGGDVANVGPSTYTTNAQQLNASTDVSTFTTSVGVYGASILSAVYAGGNGRKASECNDYRKLGGVYGNSRLYVENTKKAYPYVKYDGTTVDTQLTGIVIPYLWNIGYGGGQNGTIWGNALVHLEGGFYADNIFGGGFGDVTGASVTSADVKGNTNILINGGEAKLTSLWNSDTRTWTSAKEYNGVKYSPQYNPETKKFLINHNIYGGGNIACDVGGNTYIDMNKGMLDNKQEIVSAQQGLDKDTYDFFKTQQWKEVYNKLGSPHFGVFGGGYGEHATVSGNTYVDIALAEQAITIANAPALDNTDNLYSHFYSKQSLMDIVGGGYSGAVAGSTNVTIGGETFCRRVFGGGFYAPVGSSNVNINQVDCADIFGGGLMGNIGVHDQIDFDNSNDAIADENGIVTLNIGQSGQENSNIYIHRDAYGGNDVSGNVYKKVIINAYGGNIQGNLYGAGNGNYLYAQGEGLTKIEVNEAYRVRENVYPLVYTVPSRSFMSSVKNASAAQRMVNINSYAPQVQSVQLNLKGYSKEKPLKVKGGVFGGGNAASVNKVTADQPISVRFNFGKNIELNSVYMGCDGDAMFDTLHNYVNDFQYINNIDLTDEINWADDPANVAIPLQYLPVAPANRPIIYPHLLDLYFQPVEMSIQPTVSWGANGWDSGLTDSSSPSDAHIIFGSFICGGNRGNMNVEPSTANDATRGQYFDYTFPTYLTITDKIVGGCNNANYFMRGVTKIHHEGGYLLGKRDQKAIRMTIKSKFDVGQTTGEGSSKTYASRGNIYGGCYKSGRIAGDVSINMQSNMMNGLDSLAVANSNDKSIALCNIYGAGYGSDSYVYGNTHIEFGDKDKAASLSNGTQDGEILKYNVGNAASCNYIFGGGQQGYLIGNSNIHINNGRVTASVCGGSYAGYQYGSTNVQVGFPESYTCQRSGVYKLSRKDKWNAAEKNHDNSLVVKDEVKLLKGDVISYTLLQSVTQYEEEAKFANDEAKVGADKCFIKNTLTQPSNWSNISIKIDRAVYGGGYSLASGSSVKANSATVCKFDATEQVNGKDFTVDADFPSELPDNTSVGYGGHTSVIIKDKDVVMTTTDGKSQPSSGEHDHITISSPVLKQTTPEEGTDLFGYFYKNNTGTLVYISEEGRYFYHANGDNMPTDMHTDDKKIYLVVLSLTGEGGVYGDGHLSYSEGFRTSELQNYGYASYTPLSAKLINTFQRFDIMRVKDCCVSLLGDRDYAANGSVNTTPYSIARVGELQMVSSIPTSGSYTPLTLVEGGIITGNFDKCTRNYIGLSNNIKYIGAIYSDEDFKNASFKWHDSNGRIPENSTSTYYATKKQYYKDYTTSGTDKYHNEATFKQRNSGTAHNMIGIASGFSLKVQNVKTKEEEGKTVDDYFWGPIVGVVEVNLISVRQGEGAGYIYADNIHEDVSSSSSNNIGIDDDEYEDIDNRQAKKRTPRREEAQASTTHTAMEVSGNFVFAQKTQDNRYIVDDCFPTQFHRTAVTGQGEFMDAESSEPLAPAHYWYVTGFNYFYNAHITGYTYDSGGNEGNRIEFRMDNSDELMILSGAQNNAIVTLKSLTWKSGHDDASYSCDLEDRSTLNTSTSGNVDKSNNDVSGKYQLLLSAGSSKTYSTSGANCSLGFKDVTTETALTGETDIAEGRIAISLFDNVNNSGKDYYTAHLEKPCAATIKLTTPAYDGNNKRMDQYKRVTVETGADVSSYYTKDDETDTYAKATGTATEGTIYYNKVEGTYEYTIYLTINYVQGPDVSGSLRVYNCALPGEMIKIDKGDIKIESDQGLFQTATYWRVGPTTIADGKVNFLGNYEYSSTEEGKKDGYFTYDLSGTNTNSMLTDVEYDEDDDFILLPAYYFMNGYGVQYVFKVNGIDTEFPVTMLPSNKLIVHNYHRMMPRNAAGNVDAKDLHIDMAAERYQREVAAANALSDPTAKAAALKAVLPQPRVYLVDVTDLKAFSDYLTPPLGEVGRGPYVLGSNPDFGANMQFFIQSNITAAGTYQAPADFKGILHGDGHIISGLTASQNLITKNSGQIYNLGLVTGKIAGSAAEGSKLHCCYEFGNNRTVYRMDGESVTYPNDFDWRYGKVAYDLNEYYLDARSVQVDNAYTSLAANYIEDYYANGDYLYGGYTSETHYPNSEFLRTASSPNYGKQKTNHNTAHTIDKSRAEGYVYTPAVLYTYEEYKALEGKSETTQEAFNELTDAQKTKTRASETFSGTYKPLLDALCITPSVLSDQSLKKNDYIFFGQLQNADTKEAVLPSLNHTVPQAIATSETDDEGYHLLSSMSNRVYRAGGYYGNHTNLGFYYNTEAYAHDNGVTAIDFQGWNPQEFYPSVNEDNLTKLTKNPNVTRNLLLYASGTITRANVLNPFTYDGTTSEKYIKAHIVDKVENAPTTEFFHLVERTSADKDATGEQCLNNDFNCPIAFDVTNRAWYTRAPLYYAETTNSAWEGICLPFSVNKVTASYNGEITHFYGASDTEHGANDGNQTNVGHEYWLRGLIGVNDSKGTFKRPGPASVSGDGSPELFTAGTLTGSYNYSNSHFHDVYGDIYETGNIYKTARNYEDYYFQQNHIPYIVSFPGSRYREFDLSGKFNKSLMDGSHTNDWDASHGSHKFTGLNTEKQSITYEWLAHNDNVTISSGGDLKTVPVTDDQLSMTNTQHKATFAALTTEANGAYIMNSDGTAFTNDAAGIVLPFRTYMTVSSPAKPRYILITQGGITEEIEVDEDEDEDISESFNTPHLIVYPIGNGRICIESNYSTTINVYTTGGQLVRTLDIEEGINTFQDFQTGIYIIGNKKVMLR